MQTILDAAKKIKLFVTDVDGVLTDGGLLYDDHGHELKRFHVHDGLGLKLLQRYNIHVAIISARQSAAVTRRANELQIQHVYQGKEDKRQTMLDLMQMTNTTPEQVAYIGDDLGDLPLIKHVGLGIAVPNAHPMVRMHANWQTLAGGGNGAVRECCDLILRAQNHLSTLVEQYCQWIE